MPPQTEAKRQEAELEKREREYAMPTVTDYGTIAPDIIKAAKLKEMESKMTTDESKQYQRVRASKYGYPPTK